MTSRHEFVTTESTAIHVGRVIGLRLDTVRMPGGSVARREVIEHPGAVAVVPLDARQRVVMIEQYRHPLGRRLWELPAGLLDHGAEDPPAAAQRELLEEAGLIAGEWATLVDIASSPGFTDESVRVFLARDLSVGTRPGGGDDEESELVMERFPLAEAVSKVLAGEIVNAPAVSGLLAAHAVLTGGETPRPATAEWRDRPRAFGTRRASSA